MVIEYT